MLARLERAGLKPSPPAEPLTLLRRLSLDLIGLPPTLDEIAAFQTNVDALGRDEAYRREVERLLASPHYGERWGRLWLDAARYADSDGFEKDKPRDVWMYRDWVINALNDDLPYDQFLIEQIAGDLLPHADAERSRGHRLPAQLDDQRGRAASIPSSSAWRRCSTAWTPSARRARPDDPVRPVPHPQVRSADADRVLPDVRVPQQLPRGADHGLHAPRSEQRRADCLPTIRRIEDELRAANPDWPERMAAWEASVRRRPAGVDRRAADARHQRRPEALSCWTTARSWRPATRRRSSRPSFPCDVTRPKITAVRLELLNDPSLPHGGPGRSIYGLCALTRIQGDASRRSTIRSRRRT